MARIIIPMLAASFGYQFGVTGGVIGPTTSDFVIDSAPGAKPRVVSSALTQIAAPVRANLRALFAQEHELIHSPSNNVTGARVSNLDAKVGDPEIRLEGQNGHVHCNFRVLFLFHPTTRYRSNWTVED